MEVLTVSDLHLGKPGWGRYGEEVLDQLAQRASETDVLVIGGDVVDPTDNREENENRLREALALIGKLPIDHKLAVIGNNDLDCFDGPVGEYVGRMAPWYQESGVSLLDKAPVLIRGILFAGSLGWCNGSLFRGDLPMDRINDYWENSKRYRGRQGGLKPFTLHAICMTRLREQLRRVAAKHVVVVTHTVPTPNLVRYGDSEMDDYLNCFMGFDGSRYPDIYDPSRTRLSLVGHTHHPGQATLNGLPIINMSGGDQPRLVNIPS